MRGSGCHSQHCHRKWGIGGAEWLCSVCQVLPQEIHDLSALRSQHSGLRTEDMRWGFPGWEGRGGKTQREETDMASGGLLWNII